MGRCGETKAVRNLMTRILASKFSPILRRRTLVAAIAVVAGAIGPSVATAGDEAAFDAATGFRIARYRAPVHEAPPGGQRISIDELDRLVASGAVLLDVMPAEGGGPEPSTGAWRLIRHRENIPGSVWLADVGRGMLSAEMEIYFREGLARLTAGDTSRGVIVYCQSDCWMGWNAVKRASSLGYSNLYWYPEGTDGWRDHDRKAVPAVPVPLPRRVATSNSASQERPTDGTAATDATTASGGPEKNAREAVILLEGYAAYKMGGYEKAYEIWKPLAESGNPNAMLNISNLYEQGQGVRLDPNKAARWMRRAAETGFGPAQFNYGVMLERGKGVARNLFEAGQWFEKAAAQGDSEAAFNLGVLHATGFGGAVMDTAKFEKAKVWLEQAAAKGHGQAKAMLSTNLFTTK